MSVVVWDGKTLASDSLFNDGQIKLPIEKVWAFDWVYGERKELGCLGIVGAVSSITYMRRMFPSSYYGALPDYIDPGLLNTDIIVVGFGGLTLFSNGDLSARYPLDTKLAIGTGRDFAYGAMYAGADSTTAVKAAITYSATCAGEVTAITLERDT